MSAVDPKAEAVSPGATGSVEKVDRGGTSDSKVVNLKAEAVSPGATGSVEKVDREGTSDSKVVAPKASASKKKAAAPKPKKTRVADNRPKYSNMIADAISQLKERKGSSRQAIIKYVSSHYKVGSEVNRINAYVNIALKSGVKLGLLTQVKGSGASGSFRLGQRHKSSKKAAYPKTMVKKPIGSAKKTAEKKSKNPIGKPKTATKKKAPAKMAKSPTKKAKSPAKKPKAGPKKIKTAASKAKPKTAAKNKQKKPVKTGKK